MTAPIYTRGRATAIKQLGLPPIGKGAALTLHQITAGGDYVPGGGESAPTVTAYEGSGIRTAYKLADVDGTLVQASDVRFLVSPVLQNGSDIRGVALEGIEGEKANLGRDMLRLLTNPFWFLKCRVKGSGTQVLCGKILAGCRGGAPFSLIGFDKMTLSRA